MTQQRTQTAVPTAAQATSYPGPAKPTQLKRDLRAMSFDEGEKALAPVQMQGDDEMLDPAKHMAAMAVDEAAPEGIRDPAQLEAARVQGIRNTIAFERDEAATKARALYLEETEIDAGLETAIEPQKSELTARKKALTEAQGEADKTIAACTKDLERLDSGATPAAELNDMLARRRVDAARPASADSSATSKLADSGAYEHTKVASHNTMNEAGASVTNTTTNKLNIGLTSASEEDSSSRTTVAGDKKTTETNSTKTGVDWTKGLSQTQTATTANEEGKAKSSQSTSQTLTFGVDGASKKNEATVTQGANEKSKVATTDAITHGNGSVGASRTNEVSTDYADKSKTDASSSMRGGVTANKDGVGANANVDSSFTHTGANKLSATAKSAAGGKVSYSIEPIPETRPPLYRIVCTIKLEGSGSLGGGWGPESSEDAATKTSGKASLSASASASAIVTFSQKLDAAGVEAWKAKLAQAEKGEPSADPEFEIIAKGTGVSWDAARVLCTEGGYTNKLADGQSMGLATDLKADVKVDVSANVGLLSAGVGGGAERQSTFEGSVSREGDATTTDLKATDKDTYSANGSMGLGVAAFTVGGSNSSTKGKGYKFKVPDAYPDAAAVRTRAEQLRTPAEFEAFAKKHPTLVAGDTDIEGTGRERSYGFSAGPGSATLASGASTTNEDSIEFDDDGKVKATNKKLTGESHLGGTAKLAPITYGSNSKEQVETNVRTTKGEDGKEKQVASTDVSKTDTSTLPSLDTAGAAKLLAETLQSPSSLVTGGMKALKGKDETAVAGFFLDDADFERIMRLAEDREQWRKGFSRAANVEDWMQCGSEIRAAKGDKKLVAAALQKFAADGEHEEKAQPDTLAGKLWEAAVPKIGGGGEHARNDNIAELLGVDLGKAADRYEVPVGVGGWVKDEYRDLVIKDLSAESAEIEKLRSDGHLTRAAEKGDPILERLGKLSAALQEGADKFDNANVHAEMTNRTLQRLSKFKTTMQLIHDENDTGLEPDEEEMAGTSQAIEFERLMTICKVYAESEARLFEKIDDNFDGLLGNHSQAENITDANQLRANAKLWEPQYAEMMALAKAHGFTGGGQPFAAWRPNHARLKVAVAGQNPKGQEADVAEAASDEAARVEQRDEREAGEQNASAYATLMGGGGGYSQEVLGKEEKEAREFAAAKQHVTTDFPIREAQMQGAKAAASQAMGKCNGLTSSGTWDKVKKPAMGPYNEGYRLFAEANRKWQAAVAASKATTLAGVLPYQPNAQFIARDYEAAAASFRKGDELQG